ncbi:MAG: hypothetical protein GX083_02560 [Clostridiales bacterium]|nr:hypothetical protein [Clostridiales bacterium]
MALFSRKKEISAEEIQAKEENKKKLEDFNVTKAWGVKKYESAMQFIFDKEKRQFVVVEGPEETFKEKNPYVIDFDQVEDVVLEVEEMWFEKSGQTGQQDIFNRRNLMQDMYAKVEWHYDCYVIIKTTHPFAEEIKFKTNYKPTIVKVKSRRFLYRRGLEIGGQYRGEGIEELIRKMSEWVGREESAVKKDKVLGPLTGGGKASFGEKFLADWMDGVYIQRVENMIKHVERVDRISKLLLK